ncbi:hypothetical protein GCM10027160_04230 [Streptomyces calidiresistens]
MSATATPERAPSANGTAAAAATRRTVVRVRDIFIPPSCVCGTVLPPEEMGRAAGSADPRGDMIDVAGTELPG